MKKLTIFLIVALFAMLAIGAGWYQETVTWNTTRATYTTLVQAGKDTSNKILLPKDFQSRSKYGEDYPGTLVIDTKCVESSTTDSTAVESVLQLSDDGTNWYTHGVLDTLTSTTAGSAETSYTIYQVTAHKKAKYARIIDNGLMAAGDTVTVTHTFDKVY